MTRSTKSRAIVLLSGGMDSCVCAALASRDHDAAALHVSYGQRTEQRERESFLAICRRLNIQNKLLVRNDALRAIGGSALTDENIAVPTASPADHNIPVTYVPFRNAHFCRSRSVGRRCSGHENLYRRRRTGQLRLSRLPPRVL